MDKFLPVSRQESQLLTGLPVRGALYLTGAEVENERNTRGCLSMKLDYEPRGEESPAEPLHVLLTPPAAHQLSRMLRRAVKDYLRAEATE